MDKSETNNLPLMPVNQSFLDVFETFMDDDQKAKIRANNVRQYSEGIIDLLLKDKIINFPCVPQPSFFILQLRSSTVSKTFSQNINSPYFLVFLNAIAMKINNAQTTKLPIIYVQPKNDKLNILGAAG